jgi:hypothetical protein
MIKILLIVIVYRFIKIIAFLYIIVLYIINKESKNILKMNNGYYIRPIKVKQIPKKMSILTLIYYKIHNKCFDLTYIRIKIGEKNFIKKILKNLKIKDIIKLILFYFSGISKLFLEIIKNI